MMHKPDDIVIDRACVREVVGVFHSWTSLKAAGDACLIPGFFNDMIIRDGVAIRRNEKSGPLRGPVMGCRGAAISMLKSRPLAVVVDASCANANHRWLHGFDHRREASRASEPGGRCLRLMRNACSPH
jgi:hypothetical protein